MQEDSRPIIKQVKDEFALKEIPLVSYQTAVEKSIRSFSSIQFEHMSQVTNKHANALATLQNLMFLTRKLM